MKVLASTYRQGPPATPRPPRRSDRYVVYQFCVEPRKPNARRETDIYTHLYRTCESLALNRGFTRIEWFPAAPKRVLDEKGKPVWFLLLTVIAFRTDQDWAKVPKEH